MGYPLPSQVKAGVIFGPANEFIGTGETVFASMFSVQIEQSSLTISQRAKRQVQEPQVVSPKVSPVKNKKNVAVFSAVLSATTFTTQDEITVTSSTQAVVLKTQQPSATIKRKQVS